MDVGAGASERNAAAEPATCGAAVRRRRIRMMRKVAVTCAAAVGKLHGADTNRLIASGAAHAASDMGPLWRDAAPGRMLAAAKQPNEIVEMEAHAEQAIDGGRDSSAHDLWMQRVAYVVAVNSQGAGPSLLCAWVRPATWARRMRSG